MLCACFSNKSQTCTRPMQMKLLRVWWLDLLETVLWYPSGEEKKKHSFSIVAIELKSLGGEPSNLTEALVITILCQLIWFPQPILRQLRQSIMVFISGVRIKREEVICLRLYSCLLVQPTLYPRSYDSHMLFMSAHICLASFEKWLRWALLLLEIRSVSISQLHWPCWRDEYILKDALVLACVNILTDSLT